MRARLLVGMLLGAVLAGGVAAAIGANALPALLTSDRSRIPCMATN